MTTTYASSDDDKDNDQDETYSDDQSKVDDENGDDDKGGEREQFRQKLKSTKEALKSERKEFHDARKEGRSELHDTVFSGLSETTKDAIEDLHDIYEPKFEAIQADTTLTKEEKQTALDALHNELHEKIKALLPTDLQDDFDMLKTELKNLRNEWLNKKDDLKDEWKATKEDRKARRDERRANMKGKMRIIFGKVDNVLQKFEAKKTPETLVTRYTALMTKLDEKIATIDPETDLYTLLKSLSDDLSDRINELQS